MSESNPTSVETKKQRLGKGWALGKTFVPRRECEICKGSFHALPSLIRRGGGRFCSKRCRGQWQRTLPSRQVKLTCKECGVEFLRPPCHSDHQHCSRACVVASQQTYKSCLTCKQMFFHKPGKYCGSECKTKAISGPNNHGWKGGKPMAICEACGKEFLVHPGCKGLVCSLKCWGAIKSKKVKGHDHPTGKGGKRDDLGGLYVRSTWEANWARYLNWLVQQNQILKWEYEPDTFEFVGIRKGTRFYTPDFKVFNIDGSVEYQEVKGWLTATGKTKLNRMKKYHPSVKVVLIDTKAYKGVAKSLRKILPNWETNPKKGF